MTAAMKNGRGSQSRDAIDSRIGVKMMVTLMMRPAFVADVTATPAVSSSRIAA